MYSARCLPHKILGLTGRRGEIKTLYHQTSPECSRMILRSQSFHCGAKGMLGGGIYFAESAEETNRKSTHKGAIIKAQVIVGIQLRVQGVWNHMDLNFVRPKGAETLRGEGYSSGYDMLFMNLNEYSIYQFIIPFQFIFSLCF
jgi:hypothetical protein